MAKKTLDFERIKTILLFVLVIVMMLMVAMPVWGDLFHKGDETIRKEQEKEEKWIQREEMIKNLK